MNLSHFTDVIVPAALATLEDKSDMAALKAKAIVLIGEEPVVDEEGNPIDIEQVALIPTGTAKKQEEEEEDDEEEKKKQDDEEEEDDEEVAKSIAAKISVMVGKELKLLTTTIGNASKDIKALAVSGGDNRNDDTSRKMGWKSFGEQLRAVAAHANSHGQTTDKRLHTKAPAGMNVSIPSEGGFLIAPEFAEGIMSIVHEQEPLLDRIDVVPIQASSIKIRAIDESSRADGSRRGGVLGYWVEEGGSLTASKPKFRLIELNPRKLAVLAYITEEMLQDEPQAMDQVISTGAAEEIGFKTGDAIFNGAGVVKPLGILNSPCLISQAKETSQTADTVVTENIVNMWSRLHVSARANAVWFIDQTVEPQLHLMSQAVGTGGQLVYMPPGGISAAPYATLYGKPVVATEFNKVLGDEGDIILADMKQYLGATRGDIRADMSIHVRFLTDELAFRFIFQVDGQPWWNAALTPKSGGATQSPFITLAERA